MKKHKKIFKILLSLVLSAALAVGGFGIYVICDNSRVVITNYTYETKKASSAFDGYKICLITDFHNGKNYEKVIEAVKKAQPDIICVGGDLINMEDTDFSNAEKLLSGLVDIADVLYSYGNHEIHCENIEKMAQIAEDMGVKLINDKAMTVEKDGSHINIIGYGDDIYSDFTYHFEKQAQKRLTDLSYQFDNNELSVLLMHRPQYFETTSNLPYDLTLSGHLHGGLINIEQIRTKILQEHFGTDKYCKGEYNSGDKKLIISAGIAKEDKIYRVFNTPEIVVVEIKSL
ncbi:MAG: metallophosphoesterase [Eubacterium sp.]|nr:metallophosphoesterase [Eubacterium sp.]